MQLSISYDMISFISYMLEYDYVQHFHHVKGHNFLTSSSRTSSSL